jgi:alpha-beta hydrolase superfamily lysophospholipase
VKATTFSFAANDGNEVFVYQWWPAQEVPLRAVVQIAHGMGEHAGRYERVAERLTAAGYAVCANDQRGHGRTAHTSADLGHLADGDGWNKAVRDIYDLNRRIRADNPALPIFLLGHSMGSLMLQQYLLEHADTIDGAILSSSTRIEGLARRLVVAIARFERRRLGKRAQSPLLRWLLFGRFNRSFEPARTRYDWLSRDESRVDEYIADPLCGFVLSAQGMCDMFEALGPLANPRNVERIPRGLPIYVFSGSRDPAHGKLAGLRRLLATYERAGLERVTHRLYEDGRHEMFNETNSAEVCDDLIDWMNHSLRELARPPV